MPAYKPYNQDGKDMKEEYKNLPEGEKKLVQLTYKVKELKEHQQGGFDHLVTEIEDLKILINLLIKQRDETYPETPPQKREREDIVPETPRKQNANYKKV